MLVQRGINDVVRAIDENGVAVGCRLRGATRPNISARAGDILDIKLRPQLLGELLRHQASEYVGRTGARERHDHTHRPGRITLCRDEARAKHGVFGTPTCVFSNGAAAYVRLAGVPSKDDALRIFDRVVEVAGGEQLILEIKRPVRPA